MRWSRRCGVAASLIISCNYGNIPTATSPLASPSFTRLRASVSSDTDLRFSPGLSPAASVASVVWSLLPLTFLLVTFSIGLGRDKFTLGEVLRLEFATIELTGVAVLDFFPTLPSVGVEMGVEVLLLILFTLLIVGDLLFFLSAIIVSGCLWGWCSLRCCVTWPFALLERSTRALLLVYGQENINRIDSSVKQ